MDLKHLLHYLVWADARLMPAVAEVSDEDFTKGSEDLRGLRQLVEHYVSGYDYIWYERDKLRDRITELSEMSREDLMTAWKESLDRCVDTLGKLEGEQSMPISKDKAVNMDRDNYVLVYTDHQTYHRGQITHVIKSLGYKGANTDYYEVLLE